MNCKFPLVSVLATVFANFPISWTCTPFFRHHITFVTNIAYSAAVTVYFTFLATTGCTEHLLRLSHYHAQLEKKLFLSPIGLMLKILWEKVVFYKTKLRIKKKKIKWSINQN